MKSLDPKVFFPPLIFLLLTIGYSLIDSEGFLLSAQAANQWILDNFGGLFSWSTFSFVLVVIAIYFSPLGRMKIGGKDAVPILNKWRWFAITLTTTIATGILFWGTAEPLYHLNAPPEGLGLEPGSGEAAIFSMSTMLMHWTITPYALYTLAGLVFAISYYNRKQPFSLGAMLHPLLGERSKGPISKVIDVVSLYGLVAGMAASLGTGMLSISGGLDKTLGIPQSTLMIGLVGMIIVVTFIISSATGLMKGIRILSVLNTRAFIALGIFVLITGPTLYMFQTGGEGLLDYLANFFPRSLSLDSGIDPEWEGSWTIFYWANWLAWAPITALFLGNLSVGYTVRQYIHFNLLLPSLFGGLWMLIFSGTAMQIDITGGGLHEVMQAGGEEQVIFAILDVLPFGKVISIVFVLIMFVSFVTAADSNTSAMSGISTKGISPDTPEAPFLIKMIWGIIIGAISFVMVTTAGTDGIKMISVLGGFPALFLLILVAAGAVKMMWESYSG